MNNLEFNRGAGSLIKQRHRVTEVKPRHIHHEFSAVGQSANVDFLACPCYNLIGILVDEFHKSTAHDSETGDEKVYVFDRGFVEELIVDVIYGI